MMWLQAPAVHQALAVGRADVHARTFAHRIQAFEHGKTLSTVIILSHVPFQLSPYKT